ncbi:MAG: Na(+)-translocating NADH-quinone reductase subunit A [Bacteroidia bacterium]|nr:MAG: Na(+)-translocating NADH-quinone reductase subunit A [Bacteroidia bacterium]
MSKVIKTKRGLDIPLLGDAEKILQTPPRASEYALKPPDFHGLVPKMMIKEGTRVKAGSPLFFDKYNEDVVFTSPVSGTYTELVRGAKRRIMEIRIMPDPEDDYIDFGTESLSTMNREQVIQKLLKSGLWPMIRQRPYSVIANQNDKPRSVFVSAFKSAPLSSDMDFVVNGQEDDFQAGLDVLGMLTDGGVHLGIHADQTMSKAFTEAKGVQIHRFKGPHPVGNVGIQIYHVQPINKGETVWYADVQDVIIIGRLFKKGIYDARKIVALTGSEVLNPRYYRIITGAQINSFAVNNVRSENGLTPRFISGDVLSGEKIAPDGHIGFYDDQITIIPEGDKPELLGWLIPTIDKFSVSRTFFSFLMPWMKYRHNTNIRSGVRPFVITGIYEKVLPMDIMPMQLIKSIMINDIDMMEKLGIYEVAPEDFALCEYVCPSKIEIQTILREGLDTMRKEFT